MKPLIEQFPASETAKRMVSRVSPIYGDSYVAKWLFEVMGRELDEAKEHYDELRLQAFAETATWSMDYWEERYGLEKDERLDLETRRGNVIAKRDTRVPMNPARVEWILGEMSGRKIIVTENAAPYTFQVDMLDGRNEVDYRRLYKVLYNIKPSHQNYLFNTLMDVITYRNKSRFRFPDFQMLSTFYNFGFYIQLDGQKQLDGSWLLDQWISKGLPFENLTMESGWRHEHGVSWPGLVSDVAIGNENRYYFDGFAVNSAFGYDGSDCKFENMSVGNQFSEGSGTDLSFLAGSRWRNEELWRFDDLAIESGFLTNSRLSDRGLNAKVAWKQSNNLLFSGLGLAMSKDNQQRISYEDFQSDGAVGYQKEVPVSFEDLSLKGFFFFRSDTGLKMNASAKCSNSQSWSFPDLKSKSGYKTKTCNQHENLAMDSSVANENRLRGNNLIKDSMYYLDGTANLDGHLKLNAAIIEEEI